MHARSNHYAVGISLGLAAAMVAASAGAAPTYACALPMDLRADWHRM
jgi:hypothetical protein